MLELLAGAALIGAPLVWGIVEMRRRHKAETVATLLTVKLATAEIQVRKQEALLANRTHSDPLVNAAFAAALRALPATTAQLIRDNLRTAQRLHEDGASVGPGDVPEPVPAAPGIPIATELP